MVRFPSKLTLVLEDACYQVDILKKVVIEETTIPSPLLDPLKPCLIGYCGHMKEADQDEAIEAFTKILDSASVYLPRQHHMEVLNMEVEASKDGKKVAPKVKLKPSSSHLKYEFLGPKHTFLVIVSTKLCGRQQKQLSDVLRMHSGDISYNINVIKESMLQFTCIEFFLMKVINPLDNLKDV